MKEEHKKFNRLVKHGTVNSLGEFKNGYGELFVIYERDDIKYITGDEMDWDFGWMITNEGIVFRPFYLNDEETKQAVNILNKL